MVYVSKVSSYVRHASDITESGDQNNRCGSVKALVLICCLPIKLYDGAASCNCRGIVRGTPEGLSERNTAVACPVIRTPS